MLPWKRLSFDIPENGHFLDTKRCLNANSGRAIITVSVSLAIFFFFTALVKQITEEVLVRTLTDVNYDPKVCRDLSLRICEEVKSQVKQLGFDRYKIVCITHIGPKMSQRIKIGSLCCWDENNDNFTECSFSNRSLFAVTLVFGVYQE